MSDYGVYSGGSLKLKGGVKEGGIVKKYVYDISCSASRLIRFEARKRRRK
jgi:hypothetical protein